MAAKFLSTRRGKIILALLAGLAIFLLGMLVYFPNYSRWRELRAENQALIDRIDQLKEDIKIYQKKNQRLDQDSFIYEEIARDKLGVLREGEIVVDIQE